ncbi:MAG: MoxR family ATPase [Chloroflexota bacterium]
MAEGFAHAIDTSRRILDEVSKVVVGKDSVKRTLLVALLAEGHVLIEGLTGTGKTTLARTFAQVTSGEFKRIQFAADMLPVDITGFYAYTPAGTSTFAPGPIFANFVLADELNRATPRTQTALIEAMQESQVTIERTTHPLPRPFMVVATQLAYGAEGTYPLTEVQSDRFMLRTWTTYPGREEEGQIIEKIDFRADATIQPAATPEEVVSVQREVRKVSVSAGVRDYIIALVERVRQHPDVLVGPSPRASIALYKGSRVLALLDNRDFVIPDDVKALTIAALEHRTRVKPEAEMEEVTPLSIVEESLEEVPVPKAEPCPT